MPSAGFSLDFSTLYCRATKLLPNLRGEPNETITSTLHHATSLAVFLHGKER